MNGQKEIRPGWLTGRDQISAYTGLSKRTVSRLLADGKIPHRRLGHKLVIVRISDLDRALMQI